MTAIGLLEVLARQHGASTETDSNDIASLTRLAGELVSSSLADLERLKGYEREFVANRRVNAVDETELRRSMWQLLRDWLADATRVYDRVRSLAESAVPVCPLDQLGDAIGFVKARVSVMPERIASAVTQAREGQCIPAKELRDELHARLRA